MNIGLLGMDTGMNVDLPGLNTMLPGMNTDMNANASLPGLNAKHELSALPNLCEPCVSLGEYEEALHGTEEVRPEVFWKKNYSNTHNFSKKGRTPLLL